jgi:hypothetical protein
MRDFHSASMPSPSDELAMCFNTCSSDIPVPESPLDLILDLAEEVPYNVQALAHTCWNLLSSAQDPEGRGCRPSRCTLL